MRPLPELSYSITRQPRGDGVYFWHWDIIEIESKCPIASGNVYGSRDYAIRDAKKAVQDHYMKRGKLPWGR